jgi:phosphatidylglycerol:prolipoprotein diacylglycerol transferase
MFYHNINPNLIIVGGIHIRYYGIVYLAAFLTIFFILLNYFKNKGKKELAYSATIYIIIGTLIGGRLFYVLENFSLYYSNLLKIFYFWQGGMAFYGGMIGALSAVFIFCKKNKLDFLELTDKVVGIVPIFLALAALANFINAELYGSISGVSWCVIFPGVEGCRHPSQIYSAIMNIFIFFILFFLKRMKLKNGAISFSFLIFYGLGRFFVDFFRQYDFTLLGLSIWQYFSLITFFVGLILLIRNN